MVTESLPRPSTASKSGEPPWISNISYESTLQIMSPTKSPPAQVMERAGTGNVEFDSQRIPSSVFADKSSTAVDWSAASNESLFSIRFNNNSFSKRDHAHSHNPTGDNISKSGELNESDDLMRFRRTSSATERESDTNRLDMENKFDLDNPQKVVQWVSAVDRLSSEGKSHALEDSWNPSPSINHQSGWNGISNQSYTTKKKSGWSLCHSSSYSCCTFCNSCKWPSCCSCKWSSCCSCKWLSCCSCKRPSCGSCKWPSCSSCSYKWSNCCSCKWPSCCPCKWTSCGSCKWSSCGSCKWPSCCSCKLPRCSSCSCKWPSCWSCKWPSCSSCSCRWPSCGCKWLSWSGCCSNWPSCKCSCVDGSWAFNCCWNCKPKGMCCSSSSDTVEVSAPPTKEDLSLPQKQPSKKRSSWRC